MFQPPSGSCLSRMYFASFAIFSRFQLAQNLQIKDVIGFQRSVGFQLAPPVAFLVLRRKQPFECRADRLLDRKFDVSAANGGVPWCRPRIGTSKRSCASGVIHSLSQFDDLPGAKIAQYPQ